jgi:release factor glutamine methyltransferase
MNVERHGVSDRCTVLCSDLFSQIDEEERFDVIFWNSNFILAPEDYTYESMHERAFVDPGYQTHRKFLTEAPLRASSGGSVLLLFSSSEGDFPGLSRIAQECGRQLEILHRSTFRDGSDMAEAEYMLLKVNSTDSSPDP